MTHTLSTEQPCSVTLATWPGPRSQCGQLLDILRARTETPGVNEAVERMDERAYRERTP